MKSGRKTTDRKVDAVVSVDPEAVTDDQLDAFLLALAEALAVQEFDRLHYE